jgi:hypothetical protein
MYGESRKLWRSVLAPVQDRYMKFLIEERKRTKKRQEKYEAWAERNRIKAKEAIFDALRFAGEQAFVDGPISGAARALTRLGYPTAAKALPVVGIAAQGGFSLGSYAGKSTARNIAKGMPSAVGLDYTPEIQRYDRSALGTTRII